MTKSAFALAISFVLCLASTGAVSQWAAPVTPAIPDTVGYVSIPNAAVTPDKSHTYRAIYDATRAATDPSQVVQAVNMAGAALNAFAATGVPLRNAKFAIVFHAAATDAALDDAHYKGKFGIANPNLKVITELKRAGIEVFVCGQTLAREKIDSKSISTEVTIASAAQIVLMTYQNDGYALMTY